METFVQKLKKRKVLVGMIFILIVALLVTPMASMGNDSQGSANQIGEYVDVYGADETGTEGAIKEGTQSDDFEKTDTTTAGLYVDYSKEIEATATENGFKINLSVTTNDKRIQTERMEATDLILIMDVSGTMTSSSDNGKTVWENYQPAMVEFIEEFLAANPENQISIVGFAGNVCQAITSDDYFSLYPTKDKDENSYKYFDGTANPRSPLVHYNLTQGFVNTTEEAISTIDGAYTTAVGKKVQLSESPAYVRGKTMIPGLKADAGRNVTIDSYTNIQSGFRGGWEVIEKDGIASDYTANENVVVMLATDGVTNSSYVEYDGKDYSIRTGDGNAGDTQKALDECKLMMEKLDDAYGEDNTSLYTYALAKNKKLLEPGESNNPYVDKSFSAINSEELISAFDTITTDITSNVELWTVEDPMSDWVNFIEFSEEYESASFNDNSKTISWNLDTVTPVEGTNEAGETTYTYTISYYVELNPEADGFEYGTYYPTNKETTLDYVFSYNNDESREPVTSEFRIPTVKANEPVTVQETGGVTITKKITGTESSSETFKFLVKNGENAYTGKYYVDNAEHDASDEGVIELNGGDTATIKGLAAGSTITVTEIYSGSFFTVDKQTQSVDVLKDETEAITFTNNYNKPEVSATKSGSVNAETPVWHGDSITYTIKVANEGTTTAKGIAVKDVIPEFTTNVTDIKPTSDSNVISGTDKGYVYWFINELEAGKSMDLQFTVKVDTNFTTKDLIINQAVYGHTGETSPEAIDFDKDKDFDKKTEVITNIPPQPSMTVDKSNTPGNGEKVQGGDEIEYTITVTNTGTPDLNNVWIKDKIPASTTFVTDSASDSGEYKDAGYVEWLIDSIPTGTSKSVTFKVTVNNDAVDGQVITNIALAEHLNDKSIDDGRDPVDNSDPVTNIVEVPVVAGEEAFDDNDTVGGTEDTDGKVLGDEATDEDGTVLGEEAQTSDAMNMVPLLIVLAAVALIVLFAALQRRKREE